MKNLLVASVLLLAACGVAETVTTTEAALGGPPCIVKCWQQFSDCSDGCSPWDDYCKCVCDNRYESCKSGCTGLPKPPPRLCGFPLVGDEN